MTESWKERFFGEGGGVRGREKAEENDGLGLAVRLGVGVTIAALEGTRGEEDWGWWSLEGVERAWRLKGFWKDSGDLGGAAGASGTV